MSTIEMSHTHQSSAAGNCTSCGAPMAADQRYCLSCGARRGETRLPFARVTARAASPPPAPSSERPTALPLTWPVAAAAAALIVLALGVGVLIGNSTSKGPKVSAAPPQVITVAGGGATGAAATSQQPAARSHSGSAKHKKRASSHHASVASDKSAAKVNKQQLNSLNKLSPQQYQKQESKLPNKIQTQGKPAPIDKSKPIGGGSGSQTFK